jgi:hypothetical protein
MLSVSGVVTSYDQRPCKGSIADRVALAVAVNPKKDKVWVDNKLQPHKFATQIQLCPWFLDWLKDKKFKLHRDVKRTNIGRLFLEGAEKKDGRFGFRQIGELLPFSWKRLTANTGMIRCLFTVG